MYAILPIVTHGSDSHKLWRGPLDRMSKSSINSIVADSGSAYQMENSRNVFFKSRDPSTETFGKPKLVFSFQNSLQRGPFSRGSGFQGSLLLKYNITNGKEKLKI